MRKSEMNESQIELRANLKRFFASEDWNLDETNWFEEGLWSAYEVSSFYDNGTMTIELELNMSDVELNLILTDNITQLEIFIVMRSMPNVIGAIQKINNFKDVVDANNFRKHINNLFGVASLFAENEAGDLLELSPGHSNKLVTNK